MDSASQSAPLALSIESAPTLNPESWQAAVDLAHVQLRGVSDPQTGAESYRIEDVKLAGAWQLSASHPEFGGLSGLAALASSQLLAVTDQGGWVWIELDPATGIPNGQGRYSKIQGRKTESSSSGSYHSAEALAYHRGVAFVGFEQDHRVEAFRIRECDSQAEALQLTKVHSPFGSKTTLHPDQGIQALHIDHTQDGLVAALQARDANGYAVSGHLTKSGFLAPIILENESPDSVLTGSDTVGVITAELRRLSQSDSEMGAKITVKVGSIQLVDITLEAPLLMGNFQAIAIGRSPEQAYRLWVVSDDEFKRSEQHTLLYAIDLISTNAPKETGQPQA